MDKHARVFVAGRHGFVNHVREARGMAVPRSV
jgi:hypothetical protein